MTKTIESPRDTNTNRLIDASTIPAKTGAASPTANAPEERQERRQHRRTRLSLPVRLRTAEMEDGSFDQVLRTMNSSRSGIYLSVPKAKFHQQMRLRIVFPYTSEHDAIPTSEEYGQIVRVDQLTNGRLGIAVALQGSEHPGYSAGTKSNSNSREPGKERRVATRSSFSGTATIYDIQSGARAQGRCPDLSISGCYVDTINPFSEKAMVQLRLTLGNQNFETEARVAFRHVNFGMGLVFCELTPDQELTLMQWLDSAESESESEIVQVADKLAAPGSSEVTDRALALRLIHMLRSKGNLRESEVSILLSNYLSTDEEVNKRQSNDCL
jgi:hypothetical protein